MNTDLQKVQKQTGYQPAPGAEPLTTEAGGVDLPPVSPALHAPPAIITPTQVKQMQRTVGNRATLSRLPISSAPHGQVQRQEDDPVVAAVQAAIDATTFEDIDCLLSILNELQNAPHGGTIPVFIDGNIYQLPWGSNVGLLNSGKSRLSGFLVEAVNTYDAPALAAFLQQKGVSRVTSGEPTEAAGAIQVVFPGRDTPQRLTQEQTDAISAAADAKVLPSMETFAAARAARMFMLRALELALTNTPESEREQAIAAWYDPRRREITEMLRESDRVWLESVRPQADLRNMRWDHPNAAVRDAVLAALRMQAVVQAESNLDRVGDNQDSIDDTIAREARGAAKMGAGAANSDEEPHWCGAFAMLNSIPGGWDPDLVEAFDHADNVIAFFEYNLQAYPGRLKPWIFSPITHWWEEVQGYHGDRGSLRQHEVVSSVANLNSFADSGPRAGDIVISTFVDNEGNEGGHIATVQSWDPVMQVLFLIDGNANGYRVRQPGEADDDTNESPQERRAEAVTGRNLTSPDPDSQRHVGVRVNDYGNDQTEITITFIGRPSIVDYEDHYYRSIEPPARPDSP